VANADPTYIFMCIASGALMTSMVENQASKRTSESVLNVHSEEEKRFHYMAKHVKDNTIGFNYRMT
jgi:hypothetical protein